MKGKKLLLALAVSTILVGCGGGSGSNETSGVVGISGTPAKGIMYGAKITAQRFENNEFVDFSPAITTTTDSTTGKYSLNIPESYKGVVRIVTEAVSGTTMRCDYASCQTGSVKFGDTVAVDAGFKMNALLSGVAGQSVTVNPNVLTHMASALAEKKGISKANVDSVAQTLATTYGITGGLGSIASVDITDPAKVNAANANAIRINMLSAAIMNTASQQNGGTLASALEVVTKDYADNDGKLLEKDSSGSKAVSRNDINAAMSALLTQIKTKASTDGVTVNSLSGVELEINNKKNELALVQESDSKRETLPQVDPNASASDVVKSKAMLTEIRNLVAATNGEYGNFKDLNLAADAFANEVDAIAVAQDPSLSKIGDVLSTATQQIVDYFNEHPSAPSHTVSGVGYTLTATNTNWPDTSTDSTIGNGSRSVNLVGSVVDGTLTLTVAAGTKAQFDFTTATTGNIKTNTIKSASIELPNAKLVSTQTGKAGEFAGNMNIELKNAVETFDTAQNKTTKSAFESAKIEFINGEFSSGTSSVTASFVGNFNGENVTNGELPSGASNFVKGNATLQFKTAFSGVTNNATVTLTGENQTFDDGAVTLKVQYDVTSMTFNTPSVKAANSLTVSNQNGVVMSLTQAANDDVTGDIKVNGNQTATVKPNRIEYTDSSFETF